MRILVYPHDLGMGGSQLNAIEIAAQTKALGHQVAVFGQPGELCERIDKLGLAFIASRRVRHRPTPSIVRQLRQLVSDHRIDVIHAYEWPPILEAILGTAGTRAACVGTVMSMAVAPFLPKDLPLVVGTEQIAAAERSFGRYRVSVIEPPVDLSHNGPQVSVDTEAFRRRFGIPSEAHHVVVVSRLARELKLEGLLTAAEVVPRCGDGAVLTIVGGGPEEPQVRRSAEKVNAELGRTAVILTGQLLDPREAYAAADVVLGMGGSALRALAFAKPLIVQGECGYWEPLTPETLPNFLWTGWYGVGSNPAEGKHRLRGALEPLLASRALRDERGAYGRRLVVDRFSLTAATKRQLEVYRTAADTEILRLTRMRLAAAACTRFAIESARTMVARRRGLLSADAEDFNASPVAGRQQVKI